MLAGQLLDQQAMIRAHLKFLTLFLQRPVCTGAVAPSSRWLAAQMVAGMNLDKAEVVVELGPGTGAFTGTILGHLRPGALFLAIEINASLIDHLTRSFPEVHILHTSAENLPECLARFGKTSTDCILCGLPWAGFSQDLQDRLLAAVLKSLPAGGRFRTFAYSHGTWLPAGRRFRRLLDANFARVTTSPVVWRNLPPAFVYCCEK
jgi:phosphatidylethanolamine/phosphatidyl-N-methylethanolamine N-methyltransferase